MLVIFSEQAHLYITLPFHLKIPQVNSTKPSNSQTSTRLILPSRYPLRETPARKEYHSPAGIKKRAKCRWPVRLLPNGLISLERTPEYLIPTAKDNSVNSPLLRLPPELRNKIWAYTLGDTRIHIRKQYPVQRTKSTRAYGLVHSRRASRPLSLLRVSRQVYSDTALLSYHLTTFIFGNYNNLRAFQLALKQPQLAAVEVVVISIPLARQMYVPPPPPRQHAAMQASGVRIGGHCVRKWHDPRPEHHEDAQSNWLRCFRHYARLCSMILLKGMTSRMFWKKYGRGKEGIRSYLSRDSSARGTVGNTWAKVEMMEWLIKVPMWSYGQWTCASATKW
ncbi:hypothetical protein FB567DRAFT_614836 [Paraphoma chrysanthemicola]|uniref:DUF7730 domain-containing protein n=1 Tax=Paraphoma chrysanthemicola TaxID=798071 RepID=A0A8K0VRK5_9PLEO|nr:hypothetical protein FB567DRAFT_614836 [Paraphoma chrysanthemicola]